jgi:hypothetical protein
METPSLQRGRDGQETAMKHDDSDPPVKSAETGNVIPFRVPPPPSELDSLGKAAVAVLRLKDALHNLAELEGPELAARAAVLAVISKWSELPTLRMAIEHLQRTPWPPFGENTGTEPPVGPEGGSNE